MRENVADRTHFNKMVMTIVFLVRSAERYARKKWRHLCDLSIDSSAAAVELQVPHSAATLLNYPSTRTFPLVKMLLVRRDWCSIGRLYSYSFLFLCRLPPARSAVVAGQWLCKISLLSCSVAKHTHRWDVAISFVRASSFHYF